MCTEQSEMHQSQGTWHSSKVLNKLVCHLLVLYLQQLTPRLHKETIDMSRSTEEDLKLQVLDNCKANWLTNHRILDHGLSVAARIFSPVAC